MIDLSTYYLYFEINLNYYFYHIFVRHKLAFPGKLEDLKVLVETMKSYKEEYYSSVLLLFCAAYLYKQTFSIPGSVFMVSTSVKLTQYVYDVVLTFLRRRPNVINVV